ncbi:UDP-N-acetylmuramate dehydrogenase [Bernardetia litoralis DSM 6794]|uniref:UDP-N-acetylenolpyruvoylglucosamine reductase n=1 Tax=Bernardetia litoralis (strain ATCC 23117 / DSM 6794 / NBRC 15988 / NCIMB 1366 / Fx l1 / Sio-4) TaxID=880071 RepID=I4ALE5_BERLS|nr:UDP-N-acetylmuramate dehydrogenase [Bernardetia litoralis]AFM04780.1 UDP-N-acetylmuramate dehydrogenase [Bernardetia litoralis DSM 6794]
MKPQILQNISLKHYNTFGIDCTAKNFVEVKTVDELKTILEIVEQENYPSIFILGGGSNVLFLKNFDGLVIKNSITGIQKVDENNENIILYAGAGENWHQFVLFCLKNNYGGVENLSLIPGTVGAAPMQNIGAYGVEVRNIVKRVKVIDRKTQEQLWISNSECKFGYRSSIFKHQAKDKYIIIGVEFRLTKKNHILNTSYGAIQNSLHALNLQANQTPTINQISKAVIEIRQSKLPNPKEIGNGGSFFKNPEIPSSQFEKLKNKFPTIVGYPISEEITKVPAGWLIEQCGWKGKVVGNTGAHKNQALVLVNYGNAKGEEIWNLAKEIQKSVFDKFGITIEPEINIVG